jgi:hypothetical protein
VAVGASAGGVEALQAFAAGLPTDLDAASSWCCTSRLPGRANRDHLEVHPEEFTHLFNTILINVTGFFRDAPAWEALQPKVLPRLVEARQPNEAIRNA